MVNNRVNTAAPRILVVDDVPGFCAELKSILRAAGMRVSVCTSPLRALREVRRQPFDLMIITLVMRELGGYEIIRRVRGAGNTIPLLMITGFGSPQAAIECTRLGASDYLDKPVEPDELVARVRRILEQSHPSPAAQASAEFTQLITQDLAMQAVFELVATIAPTDSRVLILGETGTGKELIARAIHAHSRRRARPLVDINCAAIPAALLESELFGHEAGAFTGASGRRIGRFEEADGGTLFLDEIGEMDFALQAKLLRVLEDGRFYRVGGQTTLRSSARVIAATNRDLQKEVDEGRFRADLYYRLNVLSVVLPPLRERRDDVPPLAEHFFERFAASDRPRSHFADDALGILKRYHWPGNVRELEHLVERLAVLYPGRAIGADLLPERIRQVASPPPSLPVAPTGPYRLARQQFERDYVAALLHQTAGNLAAAARLAELDRAQFFRLVQRHNLLPSKSTAARRPR